MTDPMDVYLEQEKTAAERYRWWGVYLVRERRRLQGIADAVQANLPLDQHPVTLPEGMETPEELLVRVDAELALQEADQALAEVEAEDDETQLSDADLKRKLSAKAALLNRQPDEEGDY
jgi:hypothetical protein